MLPAIDRAEELKKRIQTHDGARQAYERIAKVARASEAHDDVKLDEQVVFNVANN